jgi:DNA-binding transcriptional ArsR family regulator
MSTRRDTRREELLSDTLYALADPTRRRMLQLLGTGPKPVGELVGEFALSAPAISKHLKVLRECMLVEESRGEGDARVRIYRLRPEPLEDLGAWLEHMRAFWTLQLDAFAGYVAASGAKPKRRSTPRSGSGSRPAARPRRTSPR